MADKKLTNLDLFPNTLVSADLVHIVDISDTTQDPDGSSYKLEIGSLYAFISANLPGDWRTAGNTLTGTEHAPNEFFGSLNDFDVVFKENNIERMRIRDSKIGMGTNNPTADLHVYNEDLSNPTTNYLFKVGWTPIDNFFFVRRDGSIGIYDDIPNARLSIIGDGGPFGNNIISVRDVNRTFDVFVLDNTARIKLGVNDYNNPIYGANTSYVNLNGIWNFAMSGDSKIMTMTNAAGVIGFWSVNPGPNKMYFGTSSNHDLSFRTNNTDFFYLTASNLVGVGIVSSIEARMHIKGTGSTSGTKTLLIENSSGQDALTVKDDGSVSLLNGIDTTAGSSATLNTVSGRFRKDNSSTTFTLTNSLVTANSNVQLTFLTPGITGGTKAVPVPGAGSVVITFEDPSTGIATAPSATCDITFLITN